MELRPAEKPAEEGDGTPLRREGEAVEHAFTALEGLRMGLLQIAGGLHPAYGETPAVLAEVDMFGEGTAWRILKCP